MVKRDGSPNNNHFRNRKIFVGAILTEEIDPTQPLKQELLRIKQKIAQALNSEKIMLQDLS